MGSSPGFNWYLTIYMGKFCVPMFLTLSRKPHSGASSYIARVYDYRMTWIHILAQSFSKLSQLVTRLRQGEDPFTGKRKNIIVLIGTYRSFQNCHPSMQLGIKSWTWTGCFSNLCNTLRKLKETTAGLPQKHGHLGRIIIKLPGPDLGLHIFAWAHKEHCVWYCTNNIRRHASSFTDQFPLRQGILRFQYEQQWICRSIQKFSAWEITWDFFNWIPPYYNASTR